MNEPNEIGIGALKEIVGTNRSDAKAAHDRLRGDLSDTQERVRQLEEARMEQGKHLALLLDRRNAPTEAANLRFTPAMMLAMLTLCASVVGGQKWSTWGMAEEIEKQAARMGVLDAKLDAIKQHEADVSQLQSERYDRLATEIIRIGGTQKTPERTTPVFPRGGRFDK